MYNLLRKSLTFSYKIIRPCLGGWERYNRRLYLSLTASPNLYRKMLMINHTENEKF